MAGIFEKFAWQMATGATVAVAVFCALGWHDASGAKNRAELERDGLHALIYDPKVGYIALINQCHENGDRLEQAMVDQGLELDKLRLDGDRRRIDAAARVEAAQKDARSIEAKYKRLMTAAPHGTTACERIEDIDSRFLETMR